MRDAYAMDDSKFGLKYSVVQATNQKIALSHPNRAKNKRDDALLR
jgi:hypothetical protein